VSYDVREILNALEQIAIDGRLHAAAWRAIFGLFTSEPEILDLGPRFFVITAIAHYRLAVLQAAKLIDPADKSINLGYLFRVLISRSTGRPSHCDPEVADSARADMNTLRFLKEKIDRIKGYRDRYIAHEDRRNLRNDVFERAKPAIDEVDALFEWAHKAIKKYRIAYDGGPFARTSELPSVPEVGLDDFLQVLRSGLDGPPISHASELVKNIVSLRASLRRARTTLRDGGQA
jgi:hypothetical protein